MRRLSTHYNISIVMLLKGIKSWLAWGALGVLSIYVFCLIPSIVKVEVPPPTDGVAVVPVKTEDAELSSNQKVGGVKNNQEFKKHLDTAQTLPILNKPIKPPDSTVTTNSANQSALGVTVGKTSNPNPTSFTKGGSDDDLPPVVAAFKEASEESTVVQSSRIGGIKSSNGNTSVAATATPRSSVTASPTETLPLKRVTGQARGYALLYLMHPHARVAVDEQISVLKRAQLQEVYIGVLVDGTFSVDFDYLESVLESLAEEGRQITLVLYLTNGSTMRSFKTTPIKAGFSQTDPDTFRFGIRYDPKVRSKFASIAQSTVNIFGINKQLNPLNKNYVIVMLEDNLDRDSYKAMRDLAASVIGDKADFIRNPCLGCWKGNDAESFGDPVELHSPTNPEQLNQGDGFTLDGHGLRFANEKAGNDDSLDQVKQLEITSQQRGAAYFGLWRAARQGLLEGPIDTFRRNYEIPSDEQAAAEIEVLRSGLREIE